jgi:HrpA-like RNA helicase
VSGNEAIDETYVQNDLDLFSSLPPLDWPDQWHPSEEFPTPQSVGEDAFSRLMNDEFSFQPATRPNYFGEPSLPVSKFSEHIVDITARNRNVVISSETGSGKSSHIPLILLQAGVPRIFVTSPRIVAARELLEFARKNLGPEHAHLAGYMTGNEDDSDCSPDARIIYLTEDKFFKMANRGELKHGDKVMLDEAHERTPGMVYSMALLKELQKDIDIGLLVCSATINTDKFSQYMSDPLTKQPAPVLILPGRAFPVTFSESSLSVAEVMRQKIGEGKNVLAFEPGLARQRRTAGKAAPKKSEATIHLLYGDQSPTEQKASLNSDDKHHIVGNRVAETSLTPQNKDSVVDSGLSNNGHYIAGLRRLVTEFSSKATIIQRKGRVGREKEGDATLAQPDNAPPAPLYEDRPDFDRPPIENTSVSRYIAELLSQGRKHEDLELFESPTEENLRHDYLVLRRLGAIATIGSEVVLTPVGSAIIDLPLDINMARMIAEAKFKELDYPGQDRTALLRQVAAAAAVQQVNGILDVSQYSGRRFLRTKAGKERLSNEQLSDVLFELDVFSTLYPKKLEALEKGTDAAQLAFEQHLKSRDIIPTRFQKALATYEEVCRRLKIDPTELYKPYGEQRRQIIECQITGAEEVFVHRTNKYYQDIRGDRRQTGRKSVIATPMAQLVMGIPFDIVGLGTRGRNTRRLVSGGSAVSLAQIRTFAAHRLSEKSSGYAISQKGNFVEKKAFYFDHELHVGDIEETPSPTLETRVALITAMMTGIGTNTKNELDRVAYAPGSPNASQAIKRWEEAQDLQHKSEKNLNIVKRYEDLIRQVVSASVLLKPLTVVDPEELDAVIPQVYLSSIIRPIKFKNDIPEIIKRSPDAIRLQIAENSKQYIPVSYRNNVAHITLTRDQTYLVDRGLFADIQKHHNIKIRIGTAKYLHFEEAFEHIDARKRQRAEKLERRVRSREEKAALPVATTLGLSDREQSDIVEAVKKVKVTAYDKRIIGRQKRRAARMMIRSSLFADND